MYLFICLFIYLFLHIYTTHPILGFLDLGNLVQVPLQQHADQGAQRLDNLVEFLATELFNPFLGIYTDVDIDTDMNVDIDMI